MSNKPFAIQGSDLTLGGVNLQAGATGVVIPGVTQAVDYRAEEVERRITIGGNNPNTFGSNTNLVYVMDNAEYVYQSGGAQPSQEYVPAIYNVDELDDGRIEEVDVESGGTFAAADKTRVEAADMWAIQHALGENPLDPFVAGDWTQIPFRPKMRAGAVENVGGGADAAVSYKGFRAVYARMYDDEPTISKVLIYQDTVTTTPTLEVDPSTDDDLFKVSGLANSSVIALVNIYGADDTHPTALSTLQHFAKSIIDNVILVEGSTTTAAEMKTAFYNNFNTFASRAGNRYKDFKFTKEDWFSIPGGGGSGTGATFDIFRNRHEDYLANVNTGNSQGINYQEGDVVTILGTALGGVAPDNNIVITVTGVGAGGLIESWTYAGTPPNSVFPLDNIEDGGNDQYDNSNYIYTNIQGNSYQDNEGDNDSQGAVNYNNGNVNESGDAWFGTGSEYVATYNDSIFGLFVTGADINWIATDGNSGFDGDGQVDTGSLQLVDTDGLINGDQTFVLNADGSVTFPDGTTQTTAYTEGDPNVWVQDFETMAGTSNEHVGAANSVEYLANGDIVAVFLHFGNDFNSRYNSIGRFTPTGEKVWSMKFQGAQYTDGWGLAVDNTNGFIYVAGESSVDGGYDVAILTKLAQADGAVVWSKTYDVGYDNTNVVVDVGGDYHPVVVGYAYNGTDTQIVTTKINSTTGNFIWSKAINGQGYDEAYGMAVDINNGDEVVTVGYVDQYGPTDSVATAVTEPTSNVNWTTPHTNALTNGVNFDIDISAGGVPTIIINTDDTGGRVVGDTFATILGSTLGGVNGVDDMIVKVATVAANDTDDRMVVVKYDNTGAIQWQRAIQVEAGYDCNGADAAVDSRGNIYVCGNFDYDNNGGTDSAIIIIKLNSLGNKMWTRKVQGPCEDFATSIVVGPDNCLYLSAFTGIDVNGSADYSMVIAKYNLDGTVAWQRILDNTTTWTFAGSFFFGPSGFSGSTLAVRSGYVAVVGGFGDPGDTIPRAIVAQFDTDGRVFTRGNYDFIEATFSGLLNPTASNITVAAAGKTNISLDSDDITVGDFEPTFDLASDLVGTVYRKIIADNELRNGVRVVSLSANGSVTLPAGGTVSEGYVTSNPTIQFTPARPDVDSQKLVIKGGGISYYPENGIDVEVNYTTRTIGQTLTVSVNSDTYAGQTLYWWINPEGVGISDPESGTVTLSGLGFGSFSIVVDSDDYEFRVRVSPEDHNYGPGVIGAQSPLINSGEPTFNYEHHLHLTTGNLAETSIFLGTDNHNVRTTTDGGIEITTETTTVNPPNTITITGADVAGVNLVYTRDLTETTPTWKSPVVNPATDPFIEFDVQWRILAPEIDPLLPIYVTAGTLAKPFTQWSLNPPYGSIAPDGVYTYIAPDVHAWQFGIDGTVTFPTLTVPIEDNVTPTGTGQVLQFSDSTQQAIIFGPVSTATNTSAERVIIQGAPGYVGTAGEGGDVYVWAGPGGDADGNGGDIKVRAGRGDGTGTGGYLNFQAGDSSTGTGGYINIESGESNTYGSGGDITVQARSGGEITLRTYGPGSKDWLFGADGKLTVPANSSILTNETALNIATHPTTTYTFNQAYWEAVDGDITRVVTPTGNAQYFACTVTANQDGTYTVSGINPGNSFVPGNWFKVPGNELGGATPANDIQITVATVAGAGEILTVNPTGTAVSKQWQFGTNGGLTLPGAVVNSTVAKTGVILPTTTGIPNALSGTMVELGIADGTYGPFTKGGVTFSVTVAGGGISGFINISSTTSYAVNATIGQLTSEDLGDPPGQTTNIGVDSVVQATPTALDLTKSVNKLTDGAYTLADGVEGQIMYVVRQDGSTAANIFVEVASARWDGYVYSDQPVIPFQIPFTDMVTIIFTDGAWQSSTFGSLT